MCNSPVAQEEARALWRFSGPELAPICVSVNSVSRTSLGVAAVVS